MAGKVQGADQGTSLVTTDDSQPERRQIYGRRQGRKLRPGRQDLVDRLLPQLAIPLPPASQTASSRTIDPVALFEPPPKDLWLEIGFGGGEHLAWQAEHHPEVGFLAAEYFVNGIASLLRELDKRRLRNVRLYQGDGRDLLEALPEASISRVFILFPDPWRKTRHHKRRVVQRETLDRLAHVMRDGAELRLATDHRDYLIWMLAHCCAHPAFRWLARRPDDWRRRAGDWPASRYETKALESGRAPTYLRFRRRPREST